MAQQTIAQMAYQITLHDSKTAHYQNMLDYHSRQATAAREELARILAQARLAAPPTAEHKDILGNLVASGKYNSVTNEYVTNNGKKVAHWNAGLAKIVWVTAVKSKVKSQNIQADPVAHELSKAKQRQRYAETHPAVQRPNQFI